MQGFVMLALGTYRFAVSNGGLDKIRRSSSWRFPCNERIGAPPATQFMGPGEDKVTITGVIFPHFRGGIGQVNAMRQQAGLGIAHSLVDGMGFYWGQYVIESIEESRDAFLSNGAPRKIEFSIELKRDS